MSVTATNSTGSTSATSAASAIAARIVQTARLQRRAPRRPGGHATRTARWAGAAGHFTAKRDGQDAPLDADVLAPQRPCRPSPRLNKGVRGTNGAAFKTLCRLCSSPTHGTLTLTASQLDAMLRGRTYVNVHTAKNTRGEIRGQINRVS